MAKFSALFLCFTLLLCLLVDFSMADPSAVDNLGFPELDRRQGSNSTSSSKSTPPPPPPPPPPTSPTTAITPPTPPPTSPTTTPATTAPPPPDPPVQSTPDAPVETITRAPTTRTVVSTIFSTSSRSDGVVSTLKILTSQITVETPTGSPEAQNENNGGITPATRNTIVGIVVGIGGALLFGGLAVVAWRLKRKNTNPVDEDDLMRREGSPLAAGRDMHATDLELSPFKATLDQYHKPPGVVSASSNF